MHLAPIQILKSCKEIRALIFQRLLKAKGKNFNSQKLSQPARFKLKYLSENPSTLRAFIFEKSMNIAKQISKEQCSLQSLQSLQSLKSLEFLWSLLVQQGQSRDRGTNLDFQIHFKNILENMLTTGLNFESIN